MKTTRFMNGPGGRMAALLTGFFSCVFLLPGCASRGSRFNASVYKFTYNGESYSIRSVYSGDKTDRENELISPRFLAADFDQDGMIDRLVVGKADPAEIQRIYEYGLDELARRSKLTVISPGADRYTTENSDTRFEIKTFRPPGVEPFNEFIVTNKRQLSSPANVILADRNADGILDEILRGPAAVEQFQPQYAEMIEAGLQEGRMARTGQAVLVKEK
jgi:hypothetical protein